MLDNLAGIQIYGANFSSPTNLKLFDSNDSTKAKTIKGTLLYGKNGSGKSTIARGFRKILGETIPAIRHATFLDNSGGSISLSDTDKKHIFVFDEDFIDRNVKLQEDHLDTIVMLGEQVDLTEKLATAKSDLEAAKISFEQQKGICEEYADYKNVISPQYYIFKLRTALQGDDSWAGRDKEIHDKRQNTGVRDDTYKQFQSITPQKLRSELIADFQSLKEELVAAKLGASVINPPISSLPESYLSYDCSEIQTLITTIIERPQLSAREEYLLDLVQHAQTSTLLQRIEVFEKNETTFCPYCLQEVTACYKDNLVQSIKKS